MTGKEEFGGADFILIISIFPPFLLPSPSPSCLFFSCFSSPTILPPDLPFEVAAAPPATPLLIGGAKNLCGRESLFPFLQISFFPKRIFSTCGIITELDLGVRKVLYVIASHPPLSHCLICCQRLIARKHMCTPPNTIIPSDPRTPRGSLLSHFTEARICFKFGSRIESVISFVSAT